MTESEKYKFFASLLGFYHKDKQFYNEQVADLTAKEIEEFSEYVQFKNSEMKIRLAQLAAIIKAN